MLGLRSLEVLLGGGGGITGSASGSAHQPLDGAGAQTLAPRTDK